MDQILLILCVTGMAALAGYALMRMVMNKADTRIRGRLEQQQQNRPAPAVAKGAPLKRIVERVGEAASKPFMPADRARQSALRRNLGYAGIYAPNAMRAVVGFKLICLGGGLIAGYLLGQAMGFMMLAVSFGGLIGYLAPAIWLRARIRANRNALTGGLPDALDLMVVCVEAGLTVDAALQRIGQELSLAHPRLGREFGITHMETRVGLSRTDALRNMGARTGEPELQSLAAMLIQADRFGTSIASALRIHAESLRVKRRHQAEEKAAKASVKMTFPLVLFIFPATFIIMMGPTVLSLMRSSLLK